jgi:hypothetical protein
LLYQVAQWDSPSSSYLQKVYLREYTSSWAVPAGVPDPIIKPSSKVQISRVRTAVGPAGEVHIVVICSPDGTTATLNYYKWDGTLTGPETITATNADAVAAIAVNPTDSQPWVITEDVGTGTTRLMSAYRRTAGGWQTVGASGALSRTSYNNSSADLAFTPDGTAWAVTETLSATAVAVHRFAAAWEHYTWNAGTTVIYEGAALTPDGRLCVLAKPTTIGQAVQVMYVRTW